MRKNPACRDMQDNFVNFCTCLCFFLIIDESKFVKLDDLVYTANLDDIIINRDNKSNRYFYCINFVYESFRFSTVHPLPSH